MHNYVVNRPYLEDRVRHLAGPITVFREYVFRDVLPAFNKIDAAPAKSEMNITTESPGHLPVSMKLTWLMLPRMRIKSPTIGGR